MVITILSHECGEVFSENAGTQITSTRPKLRPNGRFSREVATVVRFNPTKCWPFYRVHTTFTLGQVHQPCKTSVEFEELPAGYVYIPRDRLDTAVYCSTAEKLLVGLRPTSRYTGDKLLSQLDELLTRMETLRAERVHSNH